MAWPPTTHQDVQDEVGALRVAPPAHAHPVSQLTATGARDSTTVLHGDNAWRAVSVSFPVVVVGTPASPLTSASTARPTATVVYWLMANGVNPTNATGADLIWNAP